MQSLNNVSTTNGECKTLNSQPEHSTKSMKEGGTSVLKSNFANGDALDESSTKREPLSPANEEIVRLIGQHLNDLGLKQSADMLMKESGCRQEHLAAPSLRKHVLIGNWTKAEEILKDIKKLLKSPRHLPKMRFLILEQKFLEFLEDGKLLEALQCLRNEITPLKIYIGKVHQLSGFLMLKENVELRKSASWDGKGEKSRSKLMDKLQAYLPISVMLPPRRLTTLLAQAVKAQQENCLYHNTSMTADLESNSLLIDHSCSRKKLPCVERQVLNEHSDEVWHCKFSHNGKKLATSSKDSTVIIWDVDPVLRQVTYSRTLTGHVSGIGYLAWSPDDSHLLACATEETAQLWVWDIEAGELQTRKNLSAEDCLGCCCWATNGQSFIAGGSKGQFYQCDIDCNIIDSWEGVRVRCVAALPDNKTVLAADTQHRIRAYNFEDMTDYNVIKEDHPIMSFSLSKDSRHALINVATQGLHLWDIKEQTLLGKYQGVVQGHYTIFSCFGGSNEQFIASGSEDCKVYLWHRSKSNPIDTLSGHSKTVNCVSWNPVYTDMLASVSDDYTVRIWGPHELKSDSDSDVEL